MSRADQSFSRQKPPYGELLRRAMVTQQKTKAPVQFELAEPSRDSLVASLIPRGEGLDEYAAAMRDVMSSSGVDGLTRPFPSMGLGRRRGRNLPRPKNKSDTLLVTVTITPRPPHRSQTLADIVCRTAERL